MSKLTDYKPLTRNPNKGTQRGTGILEQSVRELGAGRSILVDKNGVILAGNHAQEAFVNAGMDDVIEVETDGKQIVVVKRTDLDADSSAGKKMAIMDNRTSEQGLAWDAVVVEDLLNEIKQDEGELDAYLESLAKDTGAVIGDEPPEDAGAQIDKAEELRVKWGVELGQLWQLGEHRLICGDCTDKAVVDRLMDGKKAELCFTDPPYGADIDYIEHEDSQEKLVQLINGFFPLAEAFSDLVALTPGINNVFLYKKPSWILGWFYGVGTGRSPWGFTAWQPILVFGKDPKLANGEGCHPDGFQFQMTPEDMEINRNLGHVVPKPLSVWVRFMERLSNAKSSIVYDPFLGSGTTLIACERLNRKCRAVEISPAYCAVSIQRWVDMTGQEPVLLDK